MTEDELLTLLAGCSCFVLEIRGASHSPVPASSWAGPLVPCKSSKGLLAGVESILQTLPHSLETCTTWLCYAMIYMITLRHILHIQQEASVCDYEAECKAPQCA